MSKRFAITVRRVGNDGHRFPAQSSNYTADTREKAISQARDKALGYPNTGDVEIVDVAEL